MQASQPIKLDISDGCFATGIKLKADQKYHFSVASTELKDKYYPANPDGLIGSPLTMNLFIPLRRHLGEPWLKLMGRIGSKGDEEITIGSCRSEYVAKSDGELFLFVNDAVLGVIPYWDFFYSSETGLKQGQMTVSVTKLKKKKKGDQCPIKISKQ